jgi:hypothetical protein
MPILSVFVSDYALRRLRVASVCSNRPIDELMEAAIFEAAIQAVPCEDGVPISAEHRSVWPAVSGVRGAQ